MIVTRCPKCGMQAQVPEGISSYLCGFCRQTFEVGGGHAVVVHPVYRSGWSTYWTIRLSIFAVLALVSTGGWLYHRMTGKTVHGITDLDDDPDDGIVTSWSGDKPFTCGGVDKVTLHDVKATFTSGAALTAGDNCEVTCTGCSLRAPFAIQANGNAKVVFVGGSLDGEVAVAATANATVDVSGGTKVSGVVSKSGNAKVTGIAPAPSAQALANATTPATTPPPAAPAHKPAKKK